ncbi:MAG: flagellar hook-length control protein FliK [Paracoccaceae bacterium]
MNVIPLSEMLRLNTVANDTEVDDNGGETSFLSAMVVLPAEGGKPSPQREEGLVTAHPGAVSLTQARVGDLDESEPVSPLVLHSNAAIDDADSTPDAPRTPTAAERSKDSATKQIYALFGQAYADPETPTRESFFLPIADRATLLATPVIDARTGSDALSQPGSYERGQPNLEGSEPTEHDMPLRPTPTKPEPCRPLIEIDQGRLSGSAEAGMAIRVFVRSTNTPTTGAFDSACGARQVQLAQRDAHSSYAKTVQVNANVRAVTSHTVSDMSAGSVESAGFPTTPARDDPLMIHRNEAVQAMRADELGAPVKTSSYWPEDVIEFPKRLGKQSVDLAPPEDTAPSTDGKTAVRREPIAEAVKTDIPAGIVRQPPETIRGIESETGAQTVESEADPPIEKHRSAGAPIARHRDDEVSTRLQPNPVNVSVLSDLTEFHFGERADAAPLVSDAAPNTRTNHPVGHVAVAHGLPKPIGTQIAEAISLAPDRTIEIALSPEELGRVRLSLTPGDGSMVLVLHAERPDTLDLLRRNIESLAQDFRDLGFHDLTFSFGQRQAPPPAQDRIDSEDPRASARNDPSPAGFGATQRSRNTVVMGIGGLDLRY